MRIVVEVALGWAKLFSFVRSTNKYINYKAIVLRCKTIICCHSIFVQVECFGLEFLFTPLRSRL